ncbi:MAG: restriction endonuclease subunit S [bacterium]
MKNTSTKPACARGWEEVHLGADDVASIVMGQSPESSTYNCEGKGLPFFQGKLDFGLRTPLATKWCSKPLKIADSGDILVSVRAPVGEVNIADQTCCIGRGVASIRARRKTVNEFLFYLLMYEKPRLDSLGSGAIFKAITRSTLANFAIHLPQLSEQCTIATVLSKIQAAIEVQHKTVAKLKELKAATMAKLFREGTHGDRSYSKSKYGEYPSIWRLLPLTRCAYVQTGIAKGRRVDGWAAVERPYLRVANVQDGYLDLAEIKTIQLKSSETARYTLRQGDVLLTEGGDFDKLGRGYIWRGQIEGCVHQNHIFAVRTNKALLTPEFLAYLVQSPYGKAYFLSVAHRTTNLACINSTKLRDFPVILPDIEEQEEIARVLGSIDFTIEAQSNMLRSIQALFSSMLHLLMTGQVRVNHLNLDEAARVP